MDDILDGSAVLIESLAIARADVLAMKYNLYAIQNIDPQVRLNSPKCRWRYNQVYNISISFL